ncbi:MAG: carbon monoxide dehydrogenase subunit G [Dehalococcoidia bacterium]|nr:carbon monoxide dehydrogenase subunit G [Dehalococcoidia bacterium]
MDIAGTHQFAAPRAAVWEAMLDPASLQAAMPGCETMDPTGEDAYAITIKVGIAAIKGTYSGTVRVADQVEGESYRLVVSGQGKPGKVNGDATMTLSDAAGGTLVTYRGDVHAQGAIARLGNRLIGGAAKLMIGQFFKGMEAEVTRRAG